ncbi:hypothetical protein BB559_004656 [Furculomyces boomerangus]|uniref:Secretory carrier-associated membrane protein n=1 Tax=Furculomyces boomerangus TaxID=61424 RepID=A0A2T9YDF5_9FUNG|nr:hypothetical protein BB559_004656 [Furculomyces boomerangus]
MNRKESNPFADPHDNPFDENNGYKFTTVEMDDPEDSPSYLNQKYEQNSFISNSRDASSNNYLGKNIDTPIYSSAKKEQFTLDQSPSSNTKITNPEDFESILLRRERELNERQKNLEAQARVLEEERLEQQRESERLRTMAIPSGFRPANNFPPLFPLIYHNIDAEIPVHDRKAVRNIFREWLSLVVILIFNFITCTILMVSSPSNLTGASSGFISSLIYVITITPSSFFLWYRPVYNAYMKDSAIFYSIFFIFNGCHLLFDLYMFIGFLSTGSGGLINFIAVLAAGKVLASVFCGITTVLWFLHGLLSLFLFKKTHSYYKNRGHSFAEAKQQAYVGFATSNAGQAAGQAAINSYVGS